MPRPKSKNPRPTPAPTPPVNKGRYWLPNDATWGGFVNVKLDEAQHEEFDTWYAANSQHVAGYLDDHLGDGIKFGLSYDAENECFVATYMGALLSGSNERYCSTSRAGTVLEVIALCVWKHEVLAQGDYGNWSPKTGRMNKWG